MLMKAVLAVANLFRNILIMAYWSFYNNNRKDADAITKVLLIVIIISIILGLLFPDIFRSGYNEGKNGPKKNISDSIRLKTDSSSKAMNEN